MAEIITKDSEEFKEITGWIKRTGKSNGTNTPGHSR